mmetsp:Transcript_958/g.1127  ORF Transcript_958/g.1127 Transcript_958/m.1127 type:complete len:106 (-) Transcript_958:7421-7738(-)
MKKSVCRGVFGLRQTKNYIFFYADQTSNTALLASLDELHTNFYQRFRDHAHEIPQLTRELLNILNCHQNEQDGCHRQELEDFPHPGGLCQGVRREKGPQEGAVGQ